MYAMQVNTVPNHDIQAQGLAAEIRNTMVISQDLQTRMEQGVQTLEDENALLREQLTALSLTNDELRNTQESEGKQGKVNLGALELHRIIQQGQLVRERSSYESKRASFDAVVKDYDEVKAKQAAQADANARRVATHVQCNRCGQAILIGSHHKCSRIRGEGLG